jgi:hypothetical protein
MSLRLIPVTLAQANDFVTAIHRHNGRLPAAKFCVGVEREGVVVGVAIAGLPKARHQADGATLEVSRVCADGTYNACSILYGACVRAAKALGYRRAITYTREAEHGASLRASGWTLDGSSAGGMWARPNQVATRALASDQHDTGPKWRWSIDLGPAITTLTWPATSPHPQPALFGEAS